MENAEYAKGLLGDIVIEEERIVYQGGIDGIEMAVENLEVCDNILSIERT